MPSSITFRGTRLFEPSVVVDVVNTLDTTGQLGAKNLCVVGDFPILKPATAYKFGSGGFDLTEVYPMDAKLLTLDKIYKSSLSNASGIARSITYVSANQSTAASFALNNASAALALTLSSTYFGGQGNNLRLQLDDPSTIPAELAANADYYKLTIRAPWQDQDGVFLIDGSNHLQVTLADGDAIEVSSAGVFSYTPSGQAAQNFTLSDYSRMDELVAVLPAVLAPLALSFSDPAKLDVISFTNGTGGSINKVLHAHTAKLIETIESFADLPFEATLAGGYEILDDFALTAPTVAGADGGAPSDANYSTALEAVEASDLSTITILSQDADHHILLKSHIAAAGLLGRERNGYVGGTAGITLANLYTGFVLPLNDERLSVCGQSITFADHKGARRSEGPEYLAYYLMCAQGALPPAEPLTRKSLSIFDTTQGWSRERDSNSVAQKSVIAVKLGPSNDLEIVRSLTSYRKDNLSVNTEVSCRESIDICSKELRKFLTSELGSRITNTTVDRVKTLAKSRLSDLRDLGAIQDFRNIAVRRTADTVFVDFDVALIEPLNFIRITANIVAGQ